MRDANDIGQALIPTLMKGYNVHVFDIAPRPASLPLSPSLTYHKGSIDPTSPALSKLFSKTRIDGIIHLAGISLEEWCEPRYGICHQVNVGGTKALLEQAAKVRKGRSKALPWVIMASSMDVFDPIIGEKDRDPKSAIGRTKLAAELLVENASESNPDLRAAIIRMDEIYGYPNSGSIASTFVPSLITNALTGLPMQYSSSKPARDYVHIDDALVAMNEVIEKVKTSDIGTGVSYLDLVSGTRKTESEVMEIVRQQTHTLSPVRDIGNGPRAQLQTPRGSGSDWKPTIDLETGIASTIADLISANEQYNLQYLTHNCPSSPLVTSPTHHIHPADERNRDLTKLDGCTVNIGFDHRGILHHLKCEDGKHCVADGEKVPSYNWNQTVFVIHQVPIPGRGRKEERKVRVRLAEEKGTGWLGLSRGNGEVGLELFGKNDLAAETSFDLEVSVEGLALMRESLTIRCKRMLPTSDYSSLEPGSRCMLSPTLRPRQIGSLCNQRKNSICE
jgi:nucleoside-diphosphate-sugar epimerase